MKITEQKIVEWFLRIALSAVLLSAVADRFGLWSPSVSAWGNWTNFVDYTEKINPWFPHGIINLVAGAATLFEVVLGVGLLTTFKTPLLAKATGFLLLTFALAMTFSTSIKAPLDYSVFVGSAAAFALSAIAKR